MVLPGNAHRPRAVLARRGHPGRAPLAGRGRPRLDARRDGRDALLAGARASHARPGDGQGARAGCSTRSRSSPPPSAACSSASWPIAWAARARSMLSILVYSLASGACGLSHDDRAARDLPLRARPRHGRRVDDGRRAHRRDLAAPSTAARRWASCSRPGRSARSWRRRGGAGAARASAGARSSSSGVLPALLVLWIRRDVPESEIWTQRDRGASGSLRVLLRARHPGATACSPPP